MKTALFSIALVSGLAGHTLRGVQDPDEATRRRELEDKIEAFLAAETEELGSALQDPQDDLKRFKQEFERVLAEREALAEELRALRTDAQQRQQARDLELIALQEQFARTAREREHEIALFERERQRSEQELAQRIEQREVMLEREREQLELQVARDAEQREREMEREREQLELQMVRELEQHEHEMLREREQLEHHLQVLQLDLERQVAAQEQAHEMAMEQQRRELVMALEQAERAIAESEMRFDRALAEADRERERMEQDYQRQLEAAEYQMQRELERAEREVERAHEARAAQEPAGVLTYGVRVADGQGQVRDVAQQRFVVRSAAEDPSCRAERRPAPVAVGHPFPVVTTNAVAPRAAAACSAPCCAGGAGQGITIIVQQGDVHLNVGSGPVNVSAPSAGSPVFPGTVWTGSAESLGTEWIGSPVFPGSIPTCVPQPPDVWVPTIFAPEDLHWVQPGTWQVPQLEIQLQTEELEEPLEEPAEDGVTYLDPRLIEIDLASLERVLDADALSTILTTQDSLVSSTLDLAAAQSDLARASSAIEAQRSTLSTGIRSLNEEESRLVDEIARLQAEVEALRDQLQHRQDQQLR